MYINSPGEDDDYDRPATPMTLAAWVELQELISELADHDVKLIADFAVVEIERRAAVDARYAASIAHNTRRAA